MPQTKVQSSGTVTEVDKNQEGTTAIIISQLSTLPIITPTETPNNGKIKEMQRQYKSRRLKSMAKMTSEKTFLEEEMKSTEGLIKCI